MANDLINFRLSSEANDIAEKLKSTGRFEDVLAVARFGLSYALYHHFDDIDPSNYRMPDQNGSNYSVGSLDGDGKIRTLILALYPGSETPYIYARSLITFGLLKIRERINLDGFQSISKLLQI